METIGREGRSSKNLITNQQSMHAVEYNDDLLIEILLRLPVISLVLFKSVCKRWLSLISTPSFRLRRNQIPTFDPPCGLLIRSCLGETYIFLPLDTRSPCKQPALKTPFTFRSELQHVDILQSSNGLLLCRGGIKNNYKYYVYNPCTNLFMMLPQCSNKIVYRTKIAFDPTKSPHYKVIQIVLVNDDDNGYDFFSKIQIQTYSSETRKWNFCGQQQLRIEFRYFDYGIYWNDAIYWLFSPLKPNVISVLDIKAEHQPLTSVYTLGLLDTKVSFTYDSMFFESRGCLLLLILCDYQCSRRINVYETRNELSGLSIKYSVNVGDITRPLPRDWSIYSLVRSIVLGELEADSFLLIELDGKLVQYKPALKTSRELCDLGLVQYKPVLKTSRELCDLGLDSSTYATFPFIASFASAGI